MIFLTILIFILAMSLPFFKTQITPIFFTRIAALAFIYAGVLTFNTLHIHSIGSGIGIFCGFFQVTYFSLFIETFLYVVGAIILLSWPLLCVPLGRVGRAKNPGPKEDTGSWPIPYYQSGQQSYNQSDHQSESGVMGIRAGLRSQTSQSGSFPIQEAGLVGQQNRSNFSAGSLFSVVAGGLPASPAYLKAARKGESEAPLHLSEGQKRGMWDGYSLENETRGVALESKEYSLIALFSTLGGSLLLSSGDLMSMYLSIELQSFGLYILATIYRDSESATGAGLKYFLLGGLSSCLILLGASLVYSFTGLTNLESIYNLVSVISMNNLSNLELGVPSALWGGPTDPSASLFSYSGPYHFPASFTRGPFTLPLPTSGEGGSSEALSTVTAEIWDKGDASLATAHATAQQASFGIKGATDSYPYLLTNNVIQGLSLGLILIIVGFLFKIAAAPFHNWSPDVYDDSPTNVTIWLTIMPKIAIVIFLLELEMGIVSVANPAIYTAPTDPVILQEALPSVSASLNSLYLAVGGSAPTASSLTSLPMDPAVNINLLLPDSFKGGGSYVLKNLFLLSSLLSLILGTVVGLAQIRIKRLLAYSSISHVGFLLLALAINSEESTESLILYLIQYTITSLNTFFILLAFGYIINSSAFRPTLRRPAYPSLVSPLAAPGPKNRDPQPSGGDFYQSLAFGTGGGSGAFAGLKERRRNSDIRFIIDLKGQFFYNPILSLSLAICLFSMAGIPPLMGFFGKFSVLYAAIGNGYFFMALVAIIVSVISAYYYLRIIRELHAEPINNKGLNENSGLSPLPTLNKSTESTNLGGLGWINSPVRDLSSLSLRSSRVKSYLLPAARLPNLRGGGGPRLSPTAPAAPMTPPAPAGPAAPTAGPFAFKRLAAPLTREQEGRYKGCGSLVLTNFHSFIIATLTLSILFFVLKPSIILNSTVLLSLSLFNG